MLDCNYLIVGAGETGLILATELAKLGKKIILAEQGEIGGSYLLSQETPKALLLEESKNFESSLKIFKDYPETFSVLRKHRQKVQTRLIHALREKNLDIKNKLETYSNLTVLEGMAEFSSKSLAEVNSESERHIISFNQAILCTGKNVMSSPEITGLDEIEFLHQHNIYLFSEIPTTLGIIGITPKNLEIASVYSNLGVKVEMFDTLDSVKSIKKLDRSGFNYIVKQLLTKQVEFHFETKIDKVSKIKSEIILRSGPKKKFTVSHLYVEVKESFQGSGLKLDVIGLNNSVRGIQASTSGQTQHRHIWAFGECSSSCSGENKYAQIFNFINKLALESDKKNNLLGNIGSTELKPNNLPYLKIIANQAVVSLGYSEKDSHSKFGSHIKSEVLEHKILTGFIKMIYRQNTGQIVGLLLAGDFANRLEDFALKSMERNFLYKDLRSYLKVIFGI